MGDGNIIVGNCPVCGEAAPDCRCPAVSPHGLSLVEKLQVVASNPLAQKCFVAETSFADLARYTVEQISGTLGGDISRVIRAAQWVHETRNDDAVNDDYANMGAAERNALIELSDAVEALK